MTKEVGTLAEIGAKPGDVVEWPGIGEYLVLNSGGVVSKVSGGLLKDGMDYPGNRFRIVSRAEETPKLWRDMTPEEKGALLLAMHDGLKVEFCSAGKWLEKKFMPFLDDHAYRIKPEPKVETVTLMTAKVYDWISEPESGCGSQNTHRITFNLIDGEPDCNSIKMEKLQ